MSTETTKKKYVPHNKKCYACGKPQGQMFLGYDPRTLKSYCLKNCRKQSEQPQGIELVPMTSENLLEIIAEYYDGYTEDMLLNLLGRTASVRLAPAHIMHLLKVAELEGIDKIQNAMVNIIEHDMMERNLDYINLTAMEDLDTEETIYEPEPEEIEEEPVVEVVKEKPKKQKKTEPEEVKEEPLEDDGDDFSF